MMQRPMPYPGGKGGSYQRSPTPFGYGQSTFNPGQFAGYGQPSNIFSFNNPNYQPYMPQTYDSGQTGQSPDIGNNPMTPQPEVMAQPLDRQVAVQTEPTPQQFINPIPPEPRDGITEPTPQQVINLKPPEPQDRIVAPIMPIGGEPTPQEFINPVPPEPQDRIVNSKTEFTPPMGYSQLFGGEPTPQQFINPIPPGGYNPTMPIGGKGGGAKRDQAPIQYGSMIPTRDPGIDVNQQALKNQIMALEDAQAAQSMYALEQLRNPDVPSGFRYPKKDLVPQIVNLPRPIFSDQAQPQMPQGNVMGAPMSTPSFPAADMGSGLGSLFNSQQLAQRLQGAAGGPSPQQSAQSIAQDRAAYAASRGGIGLANPRFQNMR
jgi:hypothetical protein